MSCSFYNLPTQFPPPRHLFRSSSLRLCDVNAASYMKIPTPIPKTRSQVSVCQTLTYLPRVPAARMPSCETAIHPPTQEVQARAGQRVAQWAPTFVVADVRFGAGLEEGCRGANAVVGHRTAKAGMPRQYICRASLGVPAFGASGALRMGQCLEHPLKFLR